MLTPEYLDVCASDLVALYSELDQSILSIVAERIARTNYVGDTSKWQIERLQEAGLVYDDVIRAIAQYSGKSQDELRKMFAAAGVQTVNADNAIYTKAGLHPTGIKQSPAMTQVLRAGLKKTGGSLKNLTMTTAVTAQTAYINASNLAYMQITSGAMSMPEAVRHAVRSAAKQGTTVRYPSGHTDQLDVAVRRASVTGVNQTCAQIQLANAEDMGCNHVETTAHIGARPSHAEWQGRVFMIVGSSREYPNLAEATGYGTGDGLCGWNCRHNFFPFLEGIDLRTYRDEDLEKLKNDGYYEAEQQQRKLERDVRATRRELAGYDAAITAATDDQTRAALQQEFDRASVKLKKQEGKLKDWIKEKELTPDPSRVQAGGFDRSVSQKAVWANKKALQNTADGGIIKTRGLTKLTENNKVVNPMDEAKYIRMKSGLEKIGCTVISAHGDDERFLIHFEAEAISDSHGILHLGDIPSASAFFEEIIHFAQMRKYGDMQTDDMIERTAREVAANRKLLAHGTEYGFTQEDFEDIRNNLAFWEKDFIRKVGVSYDESDFDRGI